MKTLYIECKMGAAGDMLAGALLELLEDRRAFMEEVNAIGIPGVHVVCEEANKCGIIGTHLSVFVNGEKEEEFYHHHEHEHEHTHHHNDLHGIEHILQHMRISEEVRADVLAVYGLIAQAEGHVHGKPVTQIHFHEVGALDAVADITMVCMLMRKLQVQQVIVSPVHVGNGQVKCAHGVLPVPAPATAYLLKDIPYYSGNVESELCTPTGAALLKYFATSFGSMPVMNVSAMGYGMGRKDFEAANCVRVLLGEVSEQENEVVELCCNLDDMTPEAVGFVTDYVLSEGALEAYTIPIGMKKSRPGILLCVMCRKKDRDRMLSLLFQHTTTLGIRENISKRYTMERSIRTLQTSFGAVRQKQAKGYGVIKEKFEYDDLARIAKEQNKSMEQIVQQLNQEKKQDEIC